MVKSIQQTTHQLCRGGVHDLENNAKDDRQSFGGPDAVDVIIHVLFDQSSGGTVGVEKGGRIQGMGGLEEGGDDGFQLVDVVNDFVAVVGFFQDVEGQQHAFKDGKEPNFRISRQVFDTGIKDGENNNVDVVLAVPHKDADGPLEDARILDGDAVAADGYFGADRFIRIYE
jgi:hypothetical protein